MYGIMTSDGEILWFEDIEDYLAALDEFGPEVVMTEEPLRSSHETSLIEAESAHVQARFNFETKPQYIAGVGLVA